MLSFPFLPYPSPSPCAVCWLRATAVSLPLGDPKEKECVCSVGVGLIPLRPLRRSPTHCVLCAPPPLPLSVSLSQSFFEGQSAPWDSAKKDENRMKNRYGNIIACACKTAPGSTPGGPLCVCVCVCVFCVCVSVCVSLCDLSAGP